MKIGKFYVYFWRYWSVGYANMKEFGLPGNIIRLGYLVIEWD